MQLNRVLLHIVLLLLFTFLFVGKSTGQGLDQHMFSYKNFLSSEQLDSNAIKQYQYIESNWHCLKNKDELLNELLLQVSDSIQIEYIYYLKYFNFLKHYKYNEASEALYYIDEVLKTRFKGILYYSYGRLQIKDKNTALTIENYQKAIEIFNKKENFKSVIHTLNSLIVWYVNIGDYESAIEIYTRSLMLCEKTNYLWGTLHLYRAYGRSIGKYDLSQSKEFLEKGYTLAQNDNSFWSISLQVEYLRYLLRYEYDENYIVLLDETISKVKNTCLNQYYGILLTFKSHVYSIEENIDSSIYYNKLALEVRKETNNNVLVGYSYLNISSNFLLRSELQKAEIYLDSARNIFELEKGLKEKRTFLYHLINYYKKNDKNDSIINVYEQLVAINQDYFNEQQLILSKNIELKNELNTKLEKEKYNLELGKRKQRIIYLILISLLLSVIVFILVLQIKNKNVRFRNLRLIYRKDKQSLAEYEKELEQLKNIFKNAISGFVIIDKFLTIQFFNESAYGIINSYYDLKLGKSILDVMPPDAKDEFRYKVNKISLNFDNQEQDIHVYDDKGKKFTYNVSFSPMVMQKEVESILLIINDVTETVRSLELEKQQSKIQQTLLNSVTESMVLIDKNRKIELINNTAASRFGGNIDDMLRSNYIQVLPEDLREFRIQKLNEVFEKKQAIVFNEEIESYNTLTCYYPDINKYGEVEFVAEFSQDLTERKLASEQINSLRQKVLRSQMNPHFIFNSLNAIQSYVLKNDALTAVKYLNSFARLIRMILDSSRYDYINLKKEIDILKYYLDLQQLRFGDKFVYQLDVDKGLDMDNLLIPAMLAQPFIENAIEHGLQHLENKGVVKISFIKKKDMVVFKVVDNGIGREASQKIQQNIQHKSQSLSTQLFQERLHTLNKISDKKITHNIVDLKDSNGVAKGTMVVINLPLIYKSDIKYI